MLIGAYLTDIINIVSYSTDANGEKTRTIIENIPCRIQDKNKIITNQKGEEVIGNSHIVISPDYDAQINYNNKIQIVKKNNYNYPNQEKEFLIKNIGRPRGFESDPGYIGAWI